ncbi:hypothetical protein F5B17DRAFT_380145 [Nemania serpens]|nr:hypothetical protein F5B17DRAFT_380145 [Nemania serpens]
MYFASMYILLLLNSRHAFLQVTKSLSLQVIIFIIFMNNLDYPGLRWTLLEHKRLNFQATSLSHLTPNTHLARLSQELSYHEEVGRHIT